jgi:acetylornithine deacetylase/succinyl-diaminopimelate desuccinylase-like protein
MKAVPTLARSLAELAASPGVKAACDWFRRERAWINEKHLALCRIPSTTFLEEARAQWMAEQFRAVGWKAQIDRAGNVIASLKDAEGASRPVVITAHLDTVLAPRTPEDIRALGDGRLSGPGVADNGAGLAALLALAAVWTACPPLEADETPPLFVATVGEEGEGNLAGIRYFCKDVSPQSYNGILVLDGPGVDHVTNRALASKRVEVAFSGPGGHSWRDAERPNPIHALSRTITLFNQRTHDWTAPPVATDLRSTSAKPRVSCHIGIVHGGSSINSIPTDAFAKADLRSEDPERLDEIARLLADCASEAADIENAESAAGRLQVRVREIGSRPGGQLPSDAPILECFRALDQHLGIRSRLDCSSTDANIPLSLGLPAVSIGVGGNGGGAHTPNEWYSPDSRELGLSRVLLAACLLAGSIE